MKWSAIILTLVLISTCFNGCGSQHVNPGNTANSKSSLNDTDAMLTRGHLFEKAGDTKSACYEYKQACEYGNCYKYESFCTPDVNIRETAADSLIDRMSLSDMKVWKDPELTGKVTDQAMLAKIALEAADPDIRLAAVKNLKNQNLLISIAMKDRNEAVRKTAAAKITDSELLFKMGMWIKPELTEQVNKQSLLTQIAQKAKDEQVRMAAVKKLTNQVILANIAMSDDDKAVRKAALARVAIKSLLSQIGIWVDPDKTEQITDQDMLKEIALEAKDADVRIAALKNIKDQDLITKIALKDKDDTVRMAAAQNITRQNLLAKIGVESKDIRLREFAVKNITSPALLGNIAREDEDIKVRILATSRLTDMVRKKTGTDNLKKYNTEYFINREPDKPEIIIPAAKKIENESGDDKAVFLNFVYRGQKSGIYFSVNKDIHEKLNSLPLSVTHKKTEKIVTKKDFILPKIDNKLQRQHLLPLVDKIKSLTPDVNKQARIAISIVQNIPYGFPDDNESGVNYRKKFPYGVIWEHTGICDEKSDLLHFLLKELGFGTAALIYKKQYHRAVGIKCPEAYDVGNSGYCYVEVTAPKIITDDSPDYLGVGKLTDFKLIKISDGRELEGVEEEFMDKNLYYDLILKANAENGEMEEADYKTYRSILDKYGMK